MLFDEIHHLFLGPGVYAALNGNSMLLAEIFNKFISAETLMAFLTVHQGIGKSSQMSGRYPGLRIHKDRAVYSHIVRRFLDKFLPPGTFYIVLQLHAQISIIPGIGKTAVNLGTGIYESSCLCQSYDFFHCLFHGILSLLNKIIIFKSFLLYSYPPAFSTKIRVRF